MYSEGNLVPSGECFAKPALLTSPPVPSRRDLLSRADAWAGLMKEVEVYSYCNMLTGLLRSDANEAREFAFRLVRDVKYPAQPCLRRDLLFGLYYLKAVTAH